MQIMKLIKNKNLVGIVLCLVVIAFWGLQAEAAIISVDSGTDLRVAGDGNCELAEAILNANSDFDGTSSDCAAGSGTDTINFSGALTITPAQALPTVTAPLIIDGTSGGSTGTCSTRSLSVVIDGSNIFSTLMSFSTGSDDSQIKGLVMHSVQSGGGVSIYNSDGVTVTCMMFGVSQDGQMALPVNGTNITVNNATNVTIGGTNAGDGVLFGDGQEALRFTGVDGASLLGSWFGLDAGGENMIGGYDNQLTIDNSTNISVGGSTSSARNVFTGAQNYTYSSAIYIKDTSSNITIQGNYFGTNYDGTDGFTEPNGYETDFIDVCTKNECGGTGGSIDNLTIGGLNPGEGNLFAGTRTGGVTIGGDVDSVYFQGNTIGLSSSSTSLGLISNIALSIEGEEDVSTANGVWIQNNTFVAEGVIGTFVKVQVATDVTVQGNKFGVYPNGATAAAVDAEPMVNLQNITRLIVGGSGANRNQFATTNLETAHLILLRTGDASVQGNYFGLASDGVTLLGSGSVGILSVMNDESLTVGGNAPLDANKFSGLLFGMLLMNSPGYVQVIGNRFTGNATGVMVVNTSFIPASTKGASIVKNGFSVTSMGIDIAEDTNGDLIPETNLGYIVNDIGDSDTGPNNYINRPVLISGTQNGADANITVMVDVPASSNSYRLDFFSNPLGLNSSGMGPAEVFEDFTIINLPNPGRYIATLPISGITVGDGITATITACEDVGCTTFGATSQISNGIAVVSGGIDTGTTADIETYLKDNGAYHLISSAYLGSQVAGDSLSGIDTNDRDGVTFDKSSYSPGDLITASVTASEVGYLNVFLDINRDGDFSDVDEWLFDDRSIATGTSAIVLPITLEQSGEYPIRFRYTTYNPQGVLNSGGEALDGEVEDYVITVSAPTVSGTVSTGRYVSVYTSPRSTESPADLLGSGVCPVNQQLTRLLRVGARDQKSGAGEVKLLQAHINRILKSQFNDAAGPVDGVFGQRTKQGVQRLQIDLNTILKLKKPLVVDGIVGQFTRSAINNSCGR